MSSNRLAWTSAALLLIWVAAAVAVFLPFAVGTSPLNAVLLQVPENQGNWWHVLVGAPFFLAFPMIWLRLRARSSTPSLTAVGKCTLWILAGISICGTVLVEAPFLLHLAGTNEWQRLVVLLVGFGIVIVSATLLWLRRSSITTMRACIAMLNTAYLANAFLCLIVYSDAAGSLHTKIGWFVTVVIVWPMSLELIGILVSSRGAQLATA